MKLQFNTFSKQKNKKTKEYFKNISLLFNWYSNPELSPRTSKNRNVEYNLLVVL